MLSPRNPKRSRRSDARPCRRRLAGPWRLAAALLLVAGAGVVAGCRKVPPPPPPTPGWVRLNVLTAEHPGHAMLGDLDRRLDGLRLQREHLLAHPDLSLPPGAVAQRMSEAAPLVPAENVANPRPPFEQLNVQAKEAFRRSLTHELERKLARDERSLREEAARTLQHALARLAEEADEERAAIAREHALPLLRGEVRGNVAREQRAMAERQYQNAVQAVDAAVAQAQRRPKDKAALDEVERVTVARAAAALHLQTAQEQERAITETYAADQTRYRQAIAGVDAKLEAAIRQVRQQHATEVAEGAAALRAEMQREVARGVAAREERFVAGAPRERRVTVSTPITFALLPEETLALRAAGLAAGAAGGDRAAAVQAIDDAVAALERERRELADLITTDTRAAVEVLARHHGYAVGFARGNGDEITGQMRGWLRDYWPPAP